MLVIHPDGCIDHGDCETECLVEAIVPGTELNVEKWPNINRKGEAIPYADEWRDKTGKAEYFSPISGQGN